MSKLSEDFGKTFLITAEISLPRGSDIKEFMHEIEEFKRLMPKLHGINAVDNPGAMLRMSSLAASIMLKQNGLDPIYQLVGRDRNQLALQADLIGAAAFEIENVLALTGDPPNCDSSDHPKARPVFDLNSVTLIKAIDLMNHGMDWGGGTLNKPTNFFIGAALAPGTTSLDGEIHKTKKKLDAGADFFQTQVVFDSSVMSDFLDRYESLIKEDIRNKILLGVLPLYSYNIIKFLRKMPGIVISDKIEKRIKDAEDPTEEGINIVAEFIDIAKEMDLAGVHIMPIGKIDALVRILENL